MQIYTRCLCGNRIRGVQRIIKYCMLVNLNHLELRARISTKQSFSAPNFEKSLNGNNFGIKERTGRKDSIGLVENALDQLMSSVKNSQRIYKADLESILEGIKREGVSVQNDVVALLGCCGKLMPDQLSVIRVDLAHKIWNLLKEQGVELQVNYYNALLKCYMENGHAVSVNKFLAEMHNVQPDEMTYLLLLGCACEVGDIKQATEIVSIMKDKGYPARELIFNHLVLGHARAGDISNSEAMLDLMNSADISVTAATITALLQGYAEVGDLEKLHRTHREAVMKRIMFDDVQIMKIVNSLVNSGQQNAVKDILKWLPAWERSNDSAVHFTAISMVHRGYVSTACEVLNILTVPVSESSPSFGVFLLEEMVRADTPVSEILLLADQLVSDGRNPLAFELAVRAALIEMKVDTALKLLEAMKHRDLPIKPHYFWPLIITANKTEGEKGVFDIVKHMQEFEVPPDFDTLQDYVIPRMALVDMQAVVRKLQDHGLSIGTLLSPLVAVTLKLSRLTTAIALCDTYKGHLQSDRLVLPLVVSYVNTRDVENTVKMLKEMTTRSTVCCDWTGQFIVNIIMFRKATTEPDQMCSLLKAFQAEGLKISSFAAESVTMYLQNRLKLESVKKMTEVVDSLVNLDINIMPTENLTTHIPHPKEMLVHDLESHLVELKSKNMNTRGVLRKLVQEYCRQGDVENALKAKEEFEASGYKFSAGMLAKLFDLMVQTGNLEEAEKSLEDFKQHAPEIVLDDYKVVDFATLLVSKGHFEDGLAVLDKHATEHKVKGGSSMSHNCWKLLNVIAEKKDGAETREVLEKLVQYGYCIYSNALLGPVIRAYLHRNELRGAVEEYKKCVARHRATPLQHELMCALMKEGGDTRDELLQQVLGASSRVHGAPSTYVSLAVALAEMGHVKELRRYLADGKKRLSGDAMELRCKRLVIEDKLHTLANILEAGRGINSVNLQPVYMSMLQIYSRRGDCDGAMALWMSIQEHGEQPSSHFLATLAALLKSHNRNIPFALPPDMQYLISERPQTLQFSKVR